MEQSSVIELPSHNVSLCLIMDVATRCCSEGASLESLEKFTGKSSAYLKSAIIAALQLGIVSCKDNIYITDKDVGEQFANIPSEELRTLVFRKYLQKWEPFIIFLRYLSLGDSGEVAARKLSSFYKFNRNDKTLAQLLTIWGKASGVLDSTGNVMMGSCNVEDEELSDDCLENVIDDCKIRLYLVKVLTEEVFKWLQKDEIEEFVNSFEKYKTDARGAIECAGRAYEDTLRRISAELNVEATKLNGIIQVANNLYSNKDAGEKHYIHSKQNGITQAIGDIRNMAGHSKEAKTLERWELSSSGAFGYILITLSNVKSIYNYVKNSKMSF